MICCSVPRPDPIFMSKTLIEEVSGSLEGKSLQHNARPSVSLKGTYGDLTSGGLSGFLSLRYQGLRPCVESVLEPVDSSPVLRLTLGYIWSLPRGVSPRPEWGHARALSSRAVAAVSRFPSRGSRDLWLSLEGFPRGFPTSLSHRAVPRATMV